MRQASRSVSLSYSIRHPRRYAILLAVLLTGVALATSTRADEQAAGLDRPNILLIIADDLGYGELGCYGGDDIPTPHIDHIARRGVRFTSGYVTAPFCAASRAGLLTGRYQTRFGFEFNPIGAQNADPAIGLPTGEKTLGDHFRGLGYATGLVGKWHLGGTAAYHPQRRGFDEFFGFLHEGHYYVPPPWNDVTTWLRRTRLPDGGTGRWTSPDGKRIESTHMRHREPDYDADNPLLRISQPVDESEYLTDAFTREAVSFINRHAERPFFLTVAYSAVHSPMQARDDDLQRFGDIDDIQRRIFAAMLSRLDRGVGEIQNALETNGLERRTLILFLSDNGGPTRELTSSNAPLRGEKGELYEGGIRVPMLMSWPGRLVEGQVENRPVISLDLHTTALAAAGALPELPEGDGKNLLPHLAPAFANRTDPQPSFSEIHEALFWRVGRKQALRQGDWKIIRNGDSDWELYNLTDDIDETDNLADQQPDRVRDLSDHYERWNAEQQPPLWGGPRRTAAAPTTDFGQPPP